MSRRPELRLPFGLKDGLPVGVDDVPQGLACGCVCPGCQQPLVARKGDVTVHHFAHHQGSSCATGLETGLHLAAKRVLAEHRRITLPAVIIEFDSYRPPLVLSPQQAFVIDDIHEEHRIGEIVPDLLVFCRGVRLMVEVRVTHAVDDTKLQKIRRLGISAVEVDLSSASRVLSMDALADAVVHDAKTKQWLFNAKSEVYRRELFVTGERKPIVTRGFALHVDQCPINMRSWRGKSFANVIDDCVHCRYAMKVDTEADFIICGGRHKVETLEELREFHAARKMESDVS